MLPNKSIESDARVELSPTRIPRSSPVSGDGDHVLMNETPSFRGISSATQFRMR